MRICQLEGHEVALWGWGREGRAAHAAIRGRLPELALTLFCDQAEAEQAFSLEDPRLRVETTAPTAARLAAFDVVLKSPGISPYVDPARTAAAAGVAFIGGSRLWFAERADADTLCVTGTKGKSTVTALLAHLLRAAGRRTALAGNIGLPLLDLLDAQADHWVIELSSYQTGDVADSGVRPHLALVTNLHSEHLDWHGGQRCYVEDKLALLTRARPRVAVLDARSPALANLYLPQTQVHWHGLDRDRGWHLRGDRLYRDDVAVLDARALPLPGRHNRGNLCAVLTALDAIGLDAMALAAHVEGFRPLPHRLQWLGRRDGLDWVDDSISTTPLASLAALEACAGRPIALLIGGHDRGLDWRAFVAAMRTAAPRALITLGQSGPRIHALLAACPLPAATRLLAAADLAEAVALARVALAGVGAGVVLLSPGAPSFDAYSDYAARGRHFAALAGFDPQASSGIPGLGVA